MAMTPAEGIGKLGFRRWYERQLIESHVYFVTCFLSLILLAATLEQVEWQGPWSHVIYMVAVMAASGIACAWSLRQYNFLLVRAECFGAQSVCAQCGTYGVMHVVSAGCEDVRPTIARGADDNTWIRVRCKKCGHEWCMENA